MRGLEWILRAQDHRIVWCLLALVVGHCGLVEDCCLVGLVETRCCCLVGATQASELQGRVVSSVRAHVLPGRSVHLFDIDIDIEFHFIYSISISIFSNLILSLFQFDIEF